MNMPHPQKKKKQKLEDGQQNVAAVASDDDKNSSFDRMDTDELANIFGFLPSNDIMRVRLNKRMREAAKKTIVPMTDFNVNSVRKYNVMTAITTALPNLQQIQLRNLRNGHKYFDGDDPDEECAGRYANFTTHDINVISRFRMLRILELCFVPLNGRYPVLFDFPLLHKLSIEYATCLKWDLEMLAGMPLLKELFCVGNDSLTGNINSLRVLKGTIEKVEIKYCLHVEGNFMDLADFPRLTVMDLFVTGVIGDIRDMEERDFLPLETLTLPKGVYGGAGYEFQRISDAPDVMRALNSFKKQRPSLLLRDWFGMLSVDSPDRYSMDDMDDGYEEELREFLDPPFYIDLVEAGSRVGYRWKADNRMTCEVNWLDPEPGRESSNYEQYIEELRVIEDRVLWRGFYEPPSEEEFNYLGQHIIS